MKEARRGDDGRRAGQSANHDMNTNSTNTTKQAVSQSSLIVASRKATLPLDPKHRAELHASGLSDDMIAAAGVFSAADGQVRDLLGWQPKAHAWGRALVFPFRFNGEAVANYHRVKLDYPRHDSKGDVIKYESPGERGTDHTYHRGPRARSQTPLLHWC